jgi:hypothetical protein
LRAGLPAGWSDHKLTQTSSSEQGATQVLVRRVPVHVDELLPHHQATCRLTVLNLQ